MVASYVFPIVHGKMFWRAGLFMPLTCGNMPVMCRTVLNMVVAQFCMSKLCSFRVATVQHHAGAVLWRTVSRVRGVQQVVFTACRVLPTACRSV